MDTKPLTAPLGGFIDWRAQMRENDVARRPDKQPASYNPPPSSRPVSQTGPDRGHVEQPGERIPTRTIPTPAQQTLPPLRRDPRQTPLPILAPPSTEPTPPPPAAPEATEMPKAKKKREPSTPETRAAAVAFVLKDGQPGAQQRAAKKFGTHESNVSQWMKRYRKTQGLPPSSRVGPVKTLLSSPESSPASSAVPAQLIVSIPGLEAHIRALVAVEVAAQLKARLRGLMSD